MMVCERNEWSVGKRREDLGRYVLENLFLHTAFKSREERLKIAHAFFRTHTIDDRGIGELLGKREFYRILQGVFVKVVPDGLERLLNGKFGFQTFGKSSGHLPFDIRIGLVQHV